MICGLGVDIADLDHITALLGRNQQRFLSVVFNAEEMLHAQAVVPSRLPSYVAGRWAAKEAVLKALGIGIGPVSLHEVTVCSAPSGQPMVELSGRAAGIAQQAG